LQAILGRLLVNTLLASGLWLVALAPALGEVNLAALGDLSDADKYRQLNLIQMVSEGVDEAFLEQLLPQSTTEEHTPPEPMPRLNIDDFQTPLNRIVDQRAMISHAAHLFRFALDNEAGITKAAAEIADSDPAQVAQVDLVQLAEDAIIVRTALAGSIEYLAIDGHPSLANKLEVYRNATIYLRNVMEYWKFDRDLNAITENAMKNTGGKMAAYQRMLEDEPNLQGFKQHLQAVEEIYKKTSGRKVKPPDLETKKLIEEESKVH